MRKGATITSLRMTIYNDLFINAGLQRMEAHETENDVMIISIFYSMICHVISCLVN